MIRTLMLGTLVLSAFTTFTFAQEPRQSTDPRDELRYEGKLFMYWDNFLRTELKAEKRIDALQAMAAFGSRGYAKEASLAIVELLKDYDNDEAAYDIDANTPTKGTPDQRIIHETIRALGKIGPDTSPVLLAQLERKGVRRVAERLYLATQKQVLGVDECTPLLIRAVQSKDEEARDAAIKILATAMFLAPKQKEHRAEFLRVVAAQKCDKAVVAALIQGMDSFELRDGEAVRVLSVLGPLARAALPALVRWDLHDSAGAGEALESIKATPADRIPVLAEVLQEEGFGSDASTAARKLGEFGANARSTLPAFMKVIKKPLREPRQFDTRVHINAERMVIVNAYVKIAGAKEALPTVADLLDKNALPQIEPELIGLYLTLETDRKQIVARLSKSLPNAMIRPRLEPVPPQVQPIGSIEAAPRSFPQEIIEALGNQGSDAASAVPVLLKWLDKADARTRLSIVETLGKIGPGARSALPVLTRLLQAPQADVQEAAAGAIEAITKNKD